MTVKITVGPPVLTINRGSTFMLTDYRGEIEPLKAHGVFADDTRFVSTYRLFVNGQRWERVSSATVNYYSARLYLTNPELPETFGESGVVAAGILALKITRSVEEGIHEALEVTNHGQDAVEVMLELELGSDFAGLFEVKAGRPRERQKLVTAWNGKRDELVTTYRNGDYLRRFTYQVDGARPAPSFANGRLRFPLHLKAGATWSASGRMLLQHGRHVRRPRKDGKGPSNGTSHKGRLHQRWVDTCTRLQTSCEELRHAYRQSVEDMGALRLFDRDLGRDVWVPAAGVPWFVTLFGRDSLIVSLQTMMVQARFAEGALRVLAEYQAEERDDWRDAQPGKIVHEVRHGELAHFDLVPHTRYYGTWDATPLYLILLREAWRWLGDRELIASLLPVAERCLHWIDSFGDLDGDGFQEYRTYSTQGYGNMSWKDAGDSVVYPDGSQVEQPKALCELQGYVYAAKLGLAEVYAALGQPERAEALRQQAAKLKRAFNRAFWMEREGTYAYGLDKDKRQIETIASNAGHCLWTGIADQDKAGRVVERLMERDMWTGWGIRTLSSENPAYDPFSYQRCSIWPHDNAIIAAGMKRYGFHQQANQVIQGILDAASRFLSYRLPELFAGLEREPDSFPVQYRRANIPQAWAAGAIFQMVQAMLGLEADVPNGQLIVDPSLPDWAPNLSLERLVVGDTHLRLRFWRDGAQSRFEVESKRGGRLEVLAKAEAASREKVA